LAACAQVGRIGNETKYKGGDFFPLLTVFLLNKEGLRRLRPSFFNFFVSLQQRSGFAACNKCDLNIKFSSITAVPPSRQLCSFINIQRALLEKPRATFTAADDIIMKTAPCRRSPKKVSSKITYKSKHRHTHYTRATRAHGRIKTFPSHTAIIFSGSFLKFLAECREELCIFSH
jgi:hypothetical protein